MWPFDDRKKIEPKPTESVPYQRPAKDGRTSSGFAKPRTGMMGNRNMNDMMKASEDDEMNRNPKAK